MLIPTPRLLLLALCGTIVIPLTGSMPIAVGIALLWLAAVATVAIVDAALAPPSAQLTWTRNHEAKLSLGAWNPVTLALQNATGRRVILRVRDAVPAALIPEGEATNGECGAGELWTLSYRVFPVHRGDYSFGAISARYLGPLGLVWRQHATEQQDQIKVYPNLLAIRSYEALVRRGQLEEIGLRNSRRWGSGTEFERLRDYTTDDEYRRINWAATARRHRPVAIDFQTERSQNVILAVDMGRLMSTRVSTLTHRTLTPQPPLPRAGEGPGVRVRPGARVDIALTRLDYALNAALLIAFVSQQYGDRVGLLAFSDRVSRYVAPAAGRRHFLTILEALYNLEAEPTEANYAEALTYLAIRSPRRSLVVMFTDIAEPEAALALVTSAAHLARRHLPLVVTLRDPSVEELAFLPLHDSRSVYERAVARTLLDDREATLLRLRQRAVLTLDVAADKLSSSLINRYLEIKARSRL